MLLAWVILIFIDLRHRFQSASTRTLIRCIFKSFHSGIPNFSVSVYIFIRYVWTEGVLAYICNEMHTMLLKIDFVP
jgi:hypothetical protein